MSGLMNKVKDALGSNSDKQGTGPGLENEHGSQSGVHDTPIEGSVAHGSSVSPTNPGVLQSTQRGIHGDRDPGVSGSGLSNQDITGQSGVGSGVGSGAGTGAGYDDSTTRTTRDSGLGGDSGRSAGPQFTGDGSHDSGLVQSGTDSTRREGGGGMTGAGYDNTRDTGLTGSGSGYDDTRGTGLTGSGSGYDDTRGTGLTGSGSGYDDTRGTGLGGDSGTSSGPQFTGDGSQDAGLVQSGVDSTRREGAGGMTGSGYDDNTRGTGLTGTDSGYDNTRDLSGGTGTGMTGTGYDENTRGTGMTGSGYDSGMTGSGSGMGSGMTGGSEQYVEGSEKHHPGDGHPEDIVHPGPHETMTAKALDPHLNQ